MNLEIDWSDPWLINKRVELAGKVSLSQSHLEFLRGELQEFNGRYKNLEEEEQRPLLDNLTSFRKGIQKAKPFPISARLLTVMFILNTEGQAIRGTAAWALSNPPELDTDTINHLFAHYFDISSGIISAVDRINIIEDEIHGLTLQRVEEENQSARKDGLLVPITMYGEIYGESIAYARESAKLLFEDMSNTPGLVPIMDLITRTQAGEPIPGILDESFRELVVLGMEHTKEIYPPLYKYIVNSGLIK